MKLVIIESPFSPGDTAAIMAHVKAHGLKGDEAGHNRVRANLLARNIAYARACVADSIARGEAPFASHLIYTQPGVLDDEDADDRAKGIEAGLSWHAVAEACIVYDDYGISSGMEQGIARAKRLGIPVIGRKLPEDWKLQAEQGAGHGDEIPGPFQTFGGGSNLLVNGEVLTPTEVLALGASSEARGIADDLILEGVRRELRGDRRAGRVLVQAGERIRDA